MGSVVLDILKESMPKIKSRLKGALVESIKSGVICGSDFKIPSPTPEVTVGVDSIDFTGILGSDDTQISKLLFNGDSSKDLNKLFKDLANQGGGSMDWSSDGEPIINITFQQSTPQEKPKFIIKIDDSRSGTNYHDFLVDYVNSLELFSTKTLMTNLMDNLFGLISTVNDLSPKKILDKLKVGASVDKILDVDFCEDNLIIDDSFFDFTDEELIDMENKSNNLSRGVSVIDLGCDVIEMSSPKETVDLLLEMEGSSSSKVDELLEKTLNTLYDNVSNQSGEDSSVIKNNFGFNLIKTLPKVVMSLVLSPKVVSLYHITDLTVNGSIDSVKNGFDFSKTKRTFFNVMCREILSIFVEIIFNKIKDELISLVTRVVTKIIKEKLSLYLAAIASVVTSKVSGKLETIKSPNI